MRVYFESPQNVAESPTSVKDPKGYQIAARRAISIEYPYLRRSIKNPARSFKFSQIWRNRRQCIYGGNAFTQVWTLYRSMPERIEVSRANETETAFAAAFAAR